MSLENLRTALSQELMSNGTYEQLTEALQTSLDGEGWTAAVQESAKRVIIQRLGNDVTGTIAAHASTSFTTKDVVDDIKPAAFSKQMRGSRH